MEERRGWWRGENGGEGRVLDVETPVLVSISVASEESDGGLAGSEVEELGSKRDLQRTITSTPDKEPSNLLPNPLLDHLRTSPQARESFEMDEVEKPLKPVSVFCFASVCFRLTYASTWNWSLG